MVRSGAVIQFGASSRSYTVNGVVAAGLAAAPTPKATNLDNWSDDWAAALGTPAKKGFERAARTLNKGITRLLRYL